MLERKPSLTDQAKAHIKQRILSGEFQDGRIPAETELANELGVSRTTIRDALSRLENEGTVYRRQGSGTYVNNPSLQIKARLEEIWSYESILRAHGYTPSTKILRMYTAPAGEESREQFEIGREEELIIVEKLFLEDEEPVILTINRMPRALIKTTFTEDDWRQPIYHFLWEHAQQRLIYYLTDIIPVIADKRLSKTLRIKQGVAMLAFEEVGYGEGNTPILLTSSYFRDDLMRLRLIRRRP